VPTFSGNSWLAISQINFASRLSHPALKAIAPWEGLTDPYRQFVARDGAPHHPSFNKMILSSFAGPGRAENMPAMLTKRPLYEDYWESKRIQVERISDIPMYLTASYSTMLHSYGSFQTFIIAKTKLKWLRVHPYQEWYDIYRHEINDELQSFYDHYAKNAPNDWENTPTLRVSLLAFDDSPASTIIEQPYTAYPPPDFHAQILYLDASTHGLSPSCPSAESTSSYHSHHLTNSSDFVYYFSRSCHLGGYPNLTIHISTSSYADMDISVQIRKISHIGEPLRHSNYPSPSIPLEKQTNVSTYLGPSGFLRASYAISKSPEPG
jgi:predicted acyl esterase